MMKIERQPYLVIILEFTPLMVAPIPNLVWEYDPVRTDDMWYAMIGVQIDAV